MKKRGEGFPLQALGIEPPRKIGSFHEPSSWIFRCQIFTMSNPFRMIDCKSTRCRLPIRYRETIHADDVRQFAYQMDIGAPFTAPVSDFTPI